MALNMETGPLKRVLQAAALFAGLEAGAQPRGTQDTAQQDVAVHTITSPDAAFGIHTELADAEVHPGASAVQLENIPVPHGYVLADQDGSSLFLSPEAQKNADTHASMNWLRVTKDIKQQLSNVIEHRGRYTPQGLRQKVVYGVFLEHVNEENTALDGYVQFFLPAETFNESGEQRWVPADTETIPFSWEKDQRISLKNSVVQPHLDSIAQGVSGTQMNRHGLIHSNIEDSHEYPFSLSRTLQFSEGAYDTLRVDCEHNGAFLRVSPNGDQYFWYGVGDPIATCSDHVDTYRGPGPLDHLRTTPLLLPKGALNKARIKESLGHALEGEMSKVPQSVEHRENEDHEVSVNIIFPSWANLPEEQNRIQEWIVSSLMPAMNNRQAVNDLTLVVDASRLSDDYNPKTMMVYLGDRPEAFDDFLNTLAHSNSLLLPAGGEKKNGRVRRVGAGASIEGARGTWTLQAKPTFITKDADGGRTLETRLGSVTREVDGALSAEKNVGLVSVSLRWVPNAENQK